MQIHRVRGQSLKDALLRAQQEFGDDAVVMQEEFAPGGGVTLSVARRSPVVTRVVPPVVSSGAANIVAKAGAASTGIRGRAAAERPGASMPVVERGDEFDPFATPLVREVARKLERTGTSRALITELCREAAEDTDPEVHVMDRVAAAIGRRFPAAGAKKLQRGTRVLAFVGLTGVGKTTTLVKLAARMIRSGRRLELATLDSRRVGAVEQLRAWSTQLGVPLTVLRTGTKPHARAFDAEGGAGVDVVLLDTTGNPTADVAELMQLQRSFAGARVAFDTWLVLPATASRTALELVTSAFADLAPEGIVVTKLDETREPAIALEHALASKLDIAFLSDGPEIATHLHRSGPEACADLFLRGRLA